VFPESAPVSSADPTRRGQPHAHDPGIDTGERREFRRWIDRLAGLGRIPQRKNAFCPLWSQPMGEIAAIAAKFGIVALPAIFSEWGAFAAFFAFFAFMPLGHTTVGILLVVIGLFYPTLPARDEKHEVRIGSEKTKLEIKGSPRTVLVGIGALVIVLSFGELAIR
jgi:hypothetical protein